MKQTKEIQDGDKMVAMIYGIAAKTCVDKFSKENAKARDVNAYRWQSCGVPSVCC